jgi:hypothetical protein
VESTTASTLITDAYTLLNVITLGSSPDARLTAQGQRFLNMMLGVWAQMPLTIPVIVREEFALLSGKGTPANPYTWGTGGDFDSPRPPNQNSVTGAALVLTVSSPNVEVPLAILTDDAYQAIQIKSLTSAQPTCFYYNPTFTTLGMGTVNLWPIPTTLSNLLAVYHTQPLTTFTSLSTTHYLPDGYVAALTLNLAKWIANAGGRSLMPETAELAATTFAQIQRANTKLTDMPNDFTIGNPLGNLRAGYNINSGTGG